MLGLGVELGLRPHFDPARKCFLARNNEQRDPWRIGHAVKSPHLTCYWCAGRVDLFRGAIRIPGNGGKRINVATDKHQWFAGDEIRGVVHLSLPR